MRLVRAQHQGRDADVEAAVQPGVPAAYGVEPADGDREPVQRLQVEVEVPLARCRCVCSESP